MLITTIDIILSLTRTSRVGYLRDVRRLTVALSRARLGLYILGRREVFDSCYELRQAFDVLFRRPDKLTLVTGELWPSQRLIKKEEGTEEEEEVPGQAIMEGVEHLGQYVFEMTQARVAQMKGTPVRMDVEVKTEVNEDDDVEHTGFEIEE